MKGFSLAFASMPGKAPALLLWLCFLLFPLGAGAETPPAPPSPSSAYTLAVIPFYSPEKIWLLYEPFIQYLRSETGLPWELKLFPDHKSLLHDVCNGTVGISLLGPVPMGRANQTCGLEPFVVALDKDGNPSYRSVVLTSDPEVTSLKLMRGRKFGVFKGSTAAHILPLKMLKDAGLGTEAIQEEFYLSQDRIMTALLSKEISAAGVKEALYRKFKNEPLRVLQTSDPLPNFSFCALPSLPAVIRERFIAVLLKLQPLANADDAEVVKGWDDEIKNGFMLPTQEYLASVRKLHAIYQEITHEE